MAVSNAEALENLYKQRDQLLEQMRAGENTIVKITGAIEVLEQLVEPEAESEPEVYNLGEESTEESSED